MKVKSPKLKNFVDKNTYQVWVDMLKLLGPSGRTQRISVLVAGMLQYVYELSMKNEQDEVMEYMLSAFEGGYEDAQELFFPLVKSLFDDAGLVWKKTNSRGQNYSVIEASIDQLFRWHDMPWE